MAYRCSRHPVVMSESDMPMPMPTVQQLGTVEVSSSCVSWIVDGFSFATEAIPAVGYKSPPFSMGAVGEECWCLCLLPYGTTHGVGRSGHMNLSLRRFSLIRLPTVKNIASLVKHGQLAHLTQPKTVSNRGAHWPEFIHLSEITNESGFLVNDQLRIHVSFLIDSSAKSVCPHKSQEAPSSSGLSNPVVPPTDLLSPAFKKWHEDSVCRDMTVEVGNDNDLVKIHKFVFASRSPVFYRMFSQNMSESNTSSMKVPDMTLKVFKELVEYMYTGKVEGLKESASDLLYAAEKYELEGLKEMCAIALAPSISKDTALNILKLADVYRVPTLKKSVLEFIKRNGKDVTFWEGWNNFLTTTPDLASEVFRYMVSTPSTLLPTAQEVSPPTPKKQRLYPSTIIRFSH